MMSVPQFDGVALLAYVDGWYEGIERSSPMSMRVIRREWGPSMVDILTANGYLAELSGMDEEPEAAPCTGVTHPCSSANGPWLTVRLPRESW